jgi:hypothetical protein
MTARSKLRIRRPSGTRVPGREQQIRFACGHHERPFSALARVRQNARAAWIRCRRCNVITVAGFARRDTQNR